MQMALISQMQAQQLGPRPMDMPGMISRGFLSTMSVIMLFMIPMITMGSFRKRRTRTIELLLTGAPHGPAGDTRKVFAAGFLFVILLLTTGYRCRLL